MFTKYYVMNQKKRDDPDMKHALRVIEERFISHYKYDPPHGGDSQGGIKIEQLDDKEKKELKRFDSTAVWTVPPQITHANRVTLLCYPPPLPFRVTIF